MGLWCCWCCINVGRGKLGKHRGDSVLWFYFLKMAWDWNWRNTSGISLTDEDLYIMRPRSHYMHPKDMQPSNIKRDFSCYPGYFPLNTHALLCLQKIMKFNLKVSLKLTWRKNGMNFCHIKMSYFRIKKAWGVDKFRSLAFNFSVHCLYHYMEFFLISYRSLSIIMNASREFLNKSNLMAIWAQAVTCS